MTTLHEVLKLLLVFGVASLGVVRCGGESPPTGGSNGSGTTLQIVAQSGSQWTGVAVSREERVFVNFPRWRAGGTGSVAEIGGDGSTHWYPSDDWNDWSEGNTDYGHIFVCVQSVYIDDENVLWVLDTGNPFLRGVVPGAAKLVRIDLASDAVVRTYTFDSTMLAPERYLNDVRIDTRKQVAYISESGLGAIIVVDLISGASRILLDGDLSTTAESTTFTVEGRTLTNSIHCDGIALTEDGGTLYYKPLSGRELFKIDTRYLRDSTLTHQALAARVEFVANVGICDGLECDVDGSLYTTSLEENAIKRLTPQPILETVCQDARFKWPDSIFITEDKMLYFTTSQLHLGGNVTDPYRVFRVRI